MKETIARDLDLNLLRVFSVVAASGSVTAAAARLDLTQPAISAALRRLSTAVGAPLYVRQGRKLALTSRGQELLSKINLHLPALIDAALAPERFAPRTSDRSVRLGLSDVAEIWLLPQLLRVLEREAPNMRLMAVPVQCQSVCEALTSAKVEVAIGGSGDLPAGIRRQSLFFEDFVCLFDARHFKVKQRLSESAYFESDHVVVSFNGDRLGMVEEVSKKTRRVRCSVSSFANLGAIVDGSSLLATAPRLVAQQIRVARPHLRTAELPFSLRGKEVALLWPAVLEGDASVGFLRERIVRIAEDAQALAKRSSPAT